MVLEVLKNGYERKGEGYYNKKHGNTAYKNKNKKTHSFYDEEDSERDSRYLESGIMGQEEEDHDDAYNLYRSLSNENRKLENNSFSNKKRNFPINKREVEELYERSREAHQFETNEGNEFFTADIYENDNFDDENFVEDEQPIEYKTYTSFNPDGKMSNLQSNIQVNNIIESENTKFKRKVKPNYDMMNYFKEYEDIFTKHHGSNSNSSSDSSSSSSSGNSSNHMSTRNKKMHYKKRSHHSKNRVEDPENDNKKHELYEKYSLRNKSSKGSQRILLPNDYEKEDSKEVGENYHGDTNVDNGFNKNSISIQKKTTEEREIENDIEEEEEEEDDDNDVEEEEEEEEESEEENSSDSYGEEKSETENSDQSEEDEEENNNSNQSDEDEEEDEENSYNSNEEDEKSINDEDSDYDEEEEDAPNDVTGKPLIRHASSYYKNTYNIKKGDAYHKEHSTINKYTEKSNKEPLKREDVYFRWNEEVDARKTKKSIVPHVKTTERNNTDTKERTEHNLQTNTIKNTSYGEIKLLGRHRKGYVEEKEERKKRNSYKETFVNKYLNRSQKKNKINVKYNYQQDGILDDVPNSNLEKRITNGEKNKKKNSHHRTFTTDPVGHYRDNNIKKRMDTVDQIILDNSFLENEEAKEAIRKKKQLRIETESELNSLSEEGTPFSKKILGLNEYALKKNEEEDKKEVKSYKEIHGENCYEDKKKHLKFFLDKMKHKKTPDDLYKKELKKLDSIQKVDKIESLKQKFTEMLYSGTFGHLFHRKSNLNNSLSGIPSKGGAGVGAGLGGMATERSNKMNVHLEKDRKLLIDRKYPTKDSEMNSVYHTGMYETKERKDKLKKGTVTTTTTTTTNNNNNNNNNKANPEIVTTTRGIDRNHVQSCCEEKTKDSNEEQPLPSQSTREDPSWKEKEGFLKSTPITYEILNGMKGGNERKYYDSKRSYKEESNSLVLNVRRNNAYDESSAGAGLIGGALRNKELQVYDNTVHVNGSNSRHEKSSKNRKVDSDEHKETFYALSSSEENIPRIGNQTNESLAVKGKKLSGREKSKEKKLMEKGKEREIERIKENKLIKKGTELELQMDNILSKKMIENAKMQSCEELDEEYIVTPFYIKSKIDKVLKNSVIFERSTRATFQQFDIKNKNFLQFSDIESLIQKLCYNLELPPVDKNILSIVYKDYDSSKNNSMNYTDFRQMYWDLLQQIKRKYYPTKNFKIKRNCIINRKKLCGYDYSTIYNYLSFKKILGRGAFGEVHLVEDNICKLYKVVKILKKKNMKNVKINEEINMLIYLDHPNIIKIFDVYENVDCTYIVMELCEGGELMNKIKEADHFNEGYIKKIMFQILCAIAYMHSHNIAHKDLKPENILFKSKGDTTLKIIDFGLAELINQTEGVSKTAAGTVLYMAPEVFKKNFTIKCDIWSVGVIMFFLFTKNLPFFGNTYEEVKHSIFHDEPNYKGLKTKISHSAVHMLKLMLEKDYTKRPTALELLHHTWFQEYLGPVEISSGTLNNIKLYMKHSNIRNIIVNIMAHEMSMVNRQIKYLNDLFCKIDVNHNGSLSHRELYIVLSSAGIKKWDINRIVQALDISDRGNITYTEFLAGCYKWKNIERTFLKAAFNKIDKDEDGYISKSDIYSLVRGKDIDTTDIDNFFVSVYSVKPNISSMQKIHKISFEDFEEYMLSTF